MEPSGMQTDLPATPLPVGGHANGGKDTLPPAQSTAVSALLANVSAQRLGLTWLKPALDETLSSIHAALEAYVQGEGHAEALRPAEEQIERLAGVFEVLDLLAPRLCALEWARLLHAMRQSGQGGRERVAPLLLALSRTGLYLDLLRRGQGPSELALRPACNALREASGLPALTPKIFLERLALLRAMPPKASAGLHREGLAEASAMLARALMSWLQGDPQAPLGMAQACARVAGLAPLREERLLWWLAQALVQTLDDPRSPRSEQLKPLLGRLNRGLKRRAEGGFEAGPRAALEALELAHELLSQLGQDALPADIGHALPPPAADVSEEEAQEAQVADPGIVAQAAKALDDALEPIQDRFDMALRMGEVQAIFDLSAELRALASVMRMLMLDAAAAELEATAQRLDEARTAGMGVDEAGLEQIAAALMFADMEIERMRLGLPEGQGIGLPILVEALSQLAAQALEDVVQAKEALLALWRGEGGEDGGEVIRASLSRVRGAFELLGLHPWAGLVERVLEFTLQAGFVPEEGEQEAVADVFASLEYGLENLRDYQQLPEPILLFGEQSLARLGKLPQAEVVACPPPVITQPEAEPTALAQPGREEGPAERAEVPQPFVPSSLLPPGADAEIVEIFIEEAREILATLRAQLPRWRAAPGDRAALTELRRAFHTLKGGARTVGLKLLGEFGWAFENMLNRVIEGVLTPSEVMFSLLDQAPPLLEQFLDALQGKASLEQARVEALCAEVDAFIAAGLSLEQRLLLSPSPPGEGRAEPEQAVSAEMQAPVTEEGLHAGAEEAPSAPTPHIEPQLYAIFRNEVEGYLQALGQAIARGREAGGIEPDAELLRIAHSLLGSARAAGVSRIVALAGQLEHLLRLAASNRQTLDAARLDLLDETLHALRLLIEDLGGCTVPLPDLAQLEQRLKEAAAGLSQPAAEAVQSGVDYDIPAAQDPILLKLFIEEAEELLQKLDEELALWRAEPQDKSHRQAMQRTLHTFKGSARMAGMRHMGDLAHHLENVFVDLDADRYPIHAELFDFIQDVLDQLHAMVDSTQLGEPIPPATELIGHLETLREREGRPIEVPREEAAPREEAVPREEAAPKEEAAAREEAATAGPVQPPRREQAQVSAEVLRVRADRIDRMVALAGESTLSRARLEQLMGGIGHQLHELDQTVTRLRAQLRRMEIENEAQMLWRFQQETGKAAGEFDPLEFDRFTLQQELSRGVMESLGDIESVQDALEDDLRDAEILLTQQGRIAQALRDDLMATRLMPFEDVVPRLARLVRQVARDLGKQAELEVHGGEVELDRGLLDHLLPALEHMLRNALAHGIERPEERRAHGKSAQGHIRLALAIQGGLMQVVLEDDGAGIDIDALRALAREKGVLDARAATDEQAAIQLIFHSGLSTAQEVSMLAGRGVGMDVVAEALRQVGGDIQVESHHGAGTRFTLIVPLTQSITQAVVVQAGEEAFALPYSGIEAILRAPRARLLALLEEDEPVFQHDGQALPLVDLAALLELPPVVGEVAGEMSPLLILRLGERRMALRIDALRGSQEVYIKALGPFLAKIPALAGASLLADGGAVLVLDAAELFRLAGQARRAAAQAEIGKPARPLVLVVDDSITIRKVTTRILERYGIEVMSAKDGLEALSWLHDHRPTVVLSDIEMPRMDGFELLALMRNDARLKSIPVVMITSRTGPKHREKAESLGVDAYIGKPYTEEELIHVLQTWIPGMSEAAASAKGGVA